MKIKKIIFAVFCAALLAVISAVIFVGATENTTRGTRDYGLTTDWNGVRLSISGYSGAPASVSQAINNSITKTSHFVEVDVERYWGSTVYEQGGDNLVLSYGKTQSGAVGQDRNNKRHYYHFVAVHGGTLSYTQTMDYLEELYTF